MEIGNITLGLLYKFKYSQGIASIKFTDNHVALLYYSGQHEYLKLDSFCARVLKYV